MEDVMICHDCHHIYDLEHKIGVRTVLVFQDCPYCGSMNVTVHAGIATAKRRERSLPEPREQDLVQKTSNQIAFRLIKGFSMLRQSGDM